MDPRLSRALTGLAENASAPLDVLMRLVACAPAAKRMAWRRDDLPEALVRKLLATGNTAVALALGDPRHPPAVRRLVAEHPDTAMRTAWTSFIEEQISRGGDVPKDLLADYAGPGGLASLAAHPDPMVRQVVASSWYDMPDDVRRALLTDPDGRVRAAAARGHRPVPADLHESLLRDEATRSAVAWYVTLTPRLAEELAEGDEIDRCDLAQNPTLPPEVRDRLLRDPEPTVLATVILRQDVPDAERRRIHAELAALPERSAESFSVGMLLGGADLDRNFLGWVYDLPLAERLRHLDSPVPAIRRAVARSDGLPADVFARLDADDEPSVRRAAAGRADTPPDVLERLVTEHGDVSHLRPMLVEHPNFPADGFVRLAAHPAPDRRRLALHGTELPVEVVTRLARDGDASVRAAAAAHPRLPGAAAAALLDDENLNVVQAAGSAAALPMTAMSRLLDDAGL